MLCSYLVSLFPIGFTHIGSVTPGIAMPRHKQWNYSLNISKINDNNDSNQRRIHILLQIYHFSKLNSLLHHCRPNQLKLMPCRTQHIQQENSIRGKKCNKIQALQPYRYFLYSKFFRNCLFAVMWHLYLLFHPLLCDSLIY